MADAWSTAPGQKPIRPNVAEIIRAAQNSSEHAGDALSGEVALEGGALRHTDVDGTVGGGSGLGRAQLGSAALSAALTLHPCVHIGGMGDASRDVVHEMLSTVGSCSVSLILDEETGAPTGEASATFANAQAAEAAIRKFDGMRFDDGLLHVTVAKRATQGSLTTRGRGRGKRAGGLTFAERQRDLVSERRLEQASAEKDAFAAARRQQVQETASDNAATAQKRQAAAEAAAAEAAKKRKLLSSRLPGVVVVRNTATATSMPPPQPSAPATVETTKEASEAPGTSGGLLGLGMYGSSDDDNDDDEGS